MAPGHRTPRCRSVAKLQLRCDLDAALNALSNRAATGVELICPLGCIPLVLRATFQQIANVDPLNDKDFVLYDHVALRLTGQPTFASVDPARLQRAPECPGESTSGGSDHVVEGGGVIGVLAGSGSVVLSDLVMSPKYHWLQLRWELCLTDRPSIPDDSYPRRVYRLVVHSTTML